MNYCIKFVNKQFGRNATPDSFYKKSMKVLSIFVRNHKYFGLAAVVLLLMHLTIQFLNYGPNPTGGLAASLLLVQAILGWNANSKKHKKGGMVYCAPYHCSTHCGSCDSAFNITIFIECTDRTENDNNQQKSAKLLICRHLH